MRLRPDTRGPCMFMNIDDHPLAERISAFHLSVARVHSKPPEKFNCHSNWNYGVQNTRKGAACLLRGLPLVPCHCLLFTCQASILLTFLQTDTPRVATQPSPCLGDLIHLSVIVTTSSLVFIPHPLVNTLATSPEPASPDPNRPCEERDNLPIPTPNASLNPLEIVKNLQNNGIALSGLIVKTPFDAGRAYIGSSPTGP